MTQRLNVAESIRISAKVSTLFIAIVLLRLIRTGMDFAH